MQRLSLIGLHLAAATAALSVTAASAQAEAGEVLWKFDLANISGAFVTVAPDGTIYTADQDRLWAINPNGTVKWTFEEAGGAGGLPVAGGGQPVDLLSDGRLVVAAGHTIWTLDPAGSVQWSFSWEGGFKNQIDNGPSVGPDGNIYATTPVNDGLGMGVFSLTGDGQLRWQDDPDPSLVIINASHSQRIRFTSSRMVFGFSSTHDTPLMDYAYDFQGNHTNFIDYTCTSSPRTSSLDRLLLAGPCGVQAVDLETDTVDWTVDFGLNVLPIAGADGVVYSGNFLGSVSAIGPEGQILWNSPSVDLLRTTAVSDEQRIFLYAVAGFGTPNKLGAINIDSGQPLWEVPYETIGGHNELSFSNEAAFSPDGSVAYFTTRFTSNGAPGRLWAVRIAETPGIPGDLDDDGQVGVSDLLILLANWGPCPPKGDCIGDLNGDDSVGVADLLILLANWG